MHFLYTRQNLVIAVTFEMKIPSSYQIFVISTHANITKKTETFQLTLLCPTSHYIHVRYISRYDCITVASISMHNQVCLIPSTANQPSQKIP